MKLKKVMILLGTVCILNTMVTGCGSGSIAKTEENQTDEGLIVTSNYLPQRAA